MSEPMPHAATIDQQAAASAAPEVGRTDPAASAASAVDRIKVPSGAAREFKQQFLLPDERFTWWVAFDEYLADVIDPVLGEALSSAIEQEVGQALGEARRRGTGVVLASNVLIGLAAVRLIGSGAVRVPLTSGEKSPTSETVHIDVSNGNRPAQWLDGLAELLMRPPQQPGDAPTLIRAWTIAPAQLQDEIDEARRAKEVDGPRLIWLASRQPGQAFAAEPPLLDLADRASNVLARVILTLGLPVGEPVQGYEKAQEHVRRLRVDLGASEDKIVAALNTPDQHRYDELASGLDEVESPRLAERLHRYLHSRSGAETRECNSPVHAASLFVAGHFPGLRPDHFIELADLLTAHTPMDHPGPADLRNPAHVTDRILEECGVQFRKKGRAGRIATISESADDDLSRSEWTTGNRLARSLARQFDKIGSLLKERYLAALAGELTLGHASNMVADQYAELEMAALADIAALNSEAAGHRLGRVVFGYAAFQRAQEGFVDVNLPRLQAALRRSIRRAPDLVREVAGRAGLPLPTVVAALCRTEPVDADQRWSDAFRKGTARLFWSLYASDPEGVTLEGFPALFNADPESVARREELLEVLGDILHFDDRDDLLHDSIRSFSEPALLARTLVEIAWRFDRLGSSANARGRLAIDVASSYLRLTGRSHRLADTLAWPAEIAVDGAPPADLLLAIALTSGDVTGVLQPAQCLPAVAGSDDPARGAALDRAGRRVWLVVRVTMATLLGSQALSGLERNILHIWLMERLGLDPAALEPSFDDRWLWQRYCDAEAAEPFDVAFRQAVGSILDLFPLAVLLSVTRRLDGPPCEVSLSASFRQWLGEPGQEMSGAPVVAFGARLEAASALLNEWAGIFGRWSMPAGRREAARAAWKERRDVLIAFGQQLRAVARERRSIQRMTVTPSGES